MSALPHAYLMALQAWLIAKLTSDPPPASVEPTGFICVGRYQDSPTNYPWVVSLNQNNPEEEVSTWKHEALEDPVQIMGGCVVAYWKYRYSVIVNYNMTITGEDQIAAHDQGSLLVQWLRRQINAATVSALNLQTSEMGETPMAQHVSHMAQRELGGPPANFITAGRIYIEQMVYIE